MRVQVIFTNGAEDTFYCQWHMRDWHGVHWFMMYDNKWTHSFCVREVRELVSQNP